MSGDADTVREALDWYPGTAMDPLRADALAALARLEARAERFAKAYALALEQLGLADRLAACEAQRDALAEALQRIADPSAELARHREDVAVGRGRTAAVPFEIARAALAEAATREEKTP